MTHSKGISWIDDCRIPFVDEKVDLEKVLKQKPKDNNFGGFDNKHFDKLWYKETGRFPANILVSDDMLNDGVIREGNKPAKRNKNHRYSMDYGLKVYDGMDITGYSDKGTSSRYYDIDKWFDKIINYE
jgi:hypothetical protein